MKNIKQLLLRITVVVIVAGLTACNDDESNNSVSVKGASFEKTFSSFSEGDGSGDVEIAVAGFNGTESGIEFEYGGTALEGADYEVVGFEGGVLTLHILEDDSLEGDEYVKIRIKNSSNGVGRSVVHTVYIGSNCEDLLGLDASVFAGDWNATEYYCGLGVTTGPCDYGPYPATLVQDPVNPNRFNFDNFYDSGYKVYLIFDLENGTVYFPDQNAGGDSSSPAISASAGTFNIDLCGGSTITVDLNYDGADWTYYFQKQ